MSELASKMCVPCQGGIPPLEGGDLTKLHEQLEDGWAIVEDHHLSRTYTFPDFAEALAFVNLVGEIAEDQNHHPDIYLAWGKVRVDIWTHKIDGLHESDFILAARIDDALIDG
jgi:4a-hydroxytetrahydrobiopterin dehydratase